MNTQLLVTVGILAVCILILKKTWCADKLADEKWEEPVRGKAQIRSVSLSFAVTPNPLKGT